MAHLHAAKLKSAQLLAGLLAAAAAPHAAAADPGADAPWGGNVALTTDYIYRGISQSGGKAALQADLHVTTGGGTFAGVWATSRDHNLEPGADAELEIYLGQRIDLSSAWSATFSARAHYFVAGTQDVSNDYQELSGALTWLDRATVSLTVIPSAVRYWYYERLPRSPAWVADAAGQWLIAPGLFVTGGVGYYRATGTGGRFEAATGYGYGNAGLAYQRRGWRLDVGYFLVENEAQQLFPYPLGNHQVAGTLSWHF